MWITLKTRSQHDKSKTSSWKKWTSKSSLVIRPSSENVVRKMRAAGLAKLTAGDRAGGTRQAFRVCINDADRDKFLDESKWPQHVIVSEWYFKPKSQEAQESKNKRGRTDSDDSSTATRRKASRSDDNDMDATILSGAVGGSPLAATSGL